MPQAAACPPEDKVRAKLAGELLISNSAFQDRHLQPQGTAKATAPEYRRTEVLRGCSYLRQSRPAGKGSLLPAKH